MKIRFTFIFLVLASEFNENMVLTNINKMKTLPTKENFTSFIVISGSVIKTVMLIFILYFRLSDKGKGSKKFLKSNLDYFWV